MLFVVYKFKQKTNRFLLIIENAKKTSINNLRDYSQTI